MKLSSLYINGYGILHDLQLSFEEDLTIIFGLNGAGKSTLLSFFRACLYGFNPRGSNQRYEPITGGIHGGQLNIWHNQMNYLIERTTDRRSAGQVNIENLTTGKTEANTKLNAILSGVSQAVFESVFAFGLRELQQLELLKDQELAAHLYSVGLGSNISLAKINQVLTGAMESIYKPRGRKPELNILLAEASELRSQLATSGKDIQEYQQLVKEISTITQQVNEYRLAINNKTKELQQTKLFLEVWPHWQEFLVLEAELAKYPDLQLPYQGLETITRATEQLNKLTTQANQLLNRISINQELVSEVDLPTLKIELASYQKLRRSQEIAVQVGAERLEKSKTESQYLTNKLTVLQQDISKLAGAGSQAELAVRQQWLKRLQDLMSLRQSKTVGNNLLTQFNMWGWLLVAILFFFTEQKLAFLITTIAFAGSITHYLITRKIRFNKDKALEAEYQELVNKLGLSNPELEIELLQQSIAQEAKLDQEALVLSRDLELKILEKNNLQKDFEEKQLQLAKVDQQWQATLRKHNLPVNWSEEQVEEFVEVAELLPDILQGIEGHQAQFQAIAELCGTDDLQKIQELFAKQNLREELSQRYTNQQILLATYFKESLDESQQLLHQLTKEELVNKQAMLELSLNELQTKLEEALNLLGSLNTKKELLENNQEQEQVKLDLEITNAKMQQLANNWATYRLSQWAIEQVKQRYEKEKQPKVLLYTSEYFKNITQGKYVRVFAPLDTQELKIEDHQGNILTVTQLSQGTVEQLYLTLRFALITCLEKEEIKLPVFVDDILVNFDHLRLGQTIELIREISKTQQIILLTCHKSMLQHFADRQIRYIEN